MVIISAVFGLTTVGGAGGALASEPVGFSPSAKVVSRAPMAVSVTFKEPLRGAGAWMRILTADGDVGTGKVTTGQKTLKRELRLGAPQGKYTVEWKVVSAKGQKMSGTFSFIAARGNGEPRRTSPVPPRPVRTEPAVDPIPTAEVIIPNDSVPGPSAASGPSEAPTTSGAPGAHSAPGASGATGVPGPSVTPEWIAGSDPLWTAQSADTSTPGAISAGPGQSGGQGVSTRFTAIPLAVGGLLVLAAGIVSLVHRPRLRS